MMQPGCGSPYSASLNPCEGVLIDWYNGEPQPWGSAFSPRPGGLQAESNGVLLGRFGWYGDDGLVTSVGDLNKTLGFVLKQGGGPTRIIWDYNAQAWRLRGGYEVTVISFGPVWARFMGGANTGDPVFADLDNGAAIAGTPAVPAILTRWRAKFSCAPGELAAISTF